MQYYSSQQSPITQFAIAGLLVLVLISLLAGPASAITNIDCNTQNSGPEQVNQDLEDAVSAHHDHSTMATPTGDSSMEANIHTEVQDCCNTECACVLAACSSLSLVSGGTWVPLHRGTLRHSFLTMSIPLKPPPAAPFRPPAFG